MNTRWRQIAKFIEKEDRWEYEYDQKYRRPRCLVCQSSLTVDSWDDERGCVETQNECKCGFMDNWSYGQTTLGVGSWVGEYSYSDSDETAITLRNEHEKQIGLYRLKIQRLKRFMYLKIDRRATKRLKYLA